MTRGRIATAVAALVLAGIPAWVLLRHAPAPPPASTGPRVPTATVRAGYVERIVRLAGRAGPAAGAQSKLAFLVAGTVLHVSVRLGDRVTAGAVLAQEDPAAYALAARQADADARAAAATAAGASVDRTSAKVRADQAELRRQRRLYQAGIVALRDVQTAEAAVAADVADARGATDQVEAAHAAALAAAARAQSAGYDLARTVLRAPSAGIVTGIFVAPGESVDASIAAIALTPAPSGIATLDVPVSELVEIATGDPVRARANGRTFAAAISGVAPAVNSATGLATASVRGVPEDVPAGTPLEAAVVVGRARGLTIPREAIVEDPGNGTTLALVQTRAQDGSLRFVARNVRIDVQDGTFARVVAGLRPGERIAARGAIDLLASAVPADNE
jgi:membrane fusion protein, heavy metal efflux system